MEFTFIHAADLHLGSPFTGLANSDPALADAMASASRDAFEALVDLAIDRKVAFVVIAGDVYDMDWKDTTIGHFFNRQISRLDREGIPSFLIKGNHDAENVVLQSVTPPPSVKTFRSAAAHTFEIPELQVAIHGQSFENRAVMQNLALTYPPAKPGWFNLGVLHTSCTGRPNHEPYSPCSVDDLLQRGYSYWALGHVHTFDVVHTTPPIVFSGCLQGRNIRESGAKGFVLVHVEDGEVTEVEHVPVDRMRWASLEVDVTDLSSEAEVLAAFGEQLQSHLQQAAGLPLIYRVTFTGSTPLHRSWHAEPDRLVEEITAAAGHRSEFATLASMRLNTCMPVEIAAGGSDALTALDLEATLSPLVDSPEVLREAAAALELLRSKLPAMSPPDSLFGSEALKQLLVEARESLLSSELLEEEA